MALNIVTDQSFDEALKWLSRKEKKTKSDVIRDLVVERYMSKKQGFRFGALAGVLKKKPSTRQIVKELKELDVDHDLD